MAAACRMHVLGFSLAIIALSQGREVLDVTTIVHEPYLMVRNDSTAKGNDVYEGFIIDLLQEVANYADFRYRIHLVTDNRYGLRESNGRWNGMIGELMDGEADLAAAPLTQTEERRSVVDFAYPFQPVTLTAIMRQDVDIHSIQELANQTQINYGTFLGGATQNAFHGATEPLYRKMWSHMASQHDPTPFVRDFADGLKKVRNGNFAFIVERPMGEFIVSQQPCDLKLIGSFRTDTTPRSFAFAMPKRHHMLNDINAAMLHLQSDMTIAMLHRKWWPDKCMLSAAGATIASGLSVHSALALSTLLLVGML